MSLHDELYAAMTELGKREDTILLGQSVVYPGTRMYSTLEGVPQEKRLEMPVSEELQLGISIGLSLEGFLPVSIFPRMNFLLCAMNQLVNHLDRLPLYSDYRPKVIIRAAVGANKPLDPGPQHQDDLTAALWRMFKTVHISQVGRVLDGNMEGPLDASALYQSAVERAGSSLVVEDGNAY